MALLLAPAVAQAQPAPADTGTIVTRLPLERELENEIMCTCGCRLPAGSCGMFQCQGKSKQLGRLKELVEAGHDKETILATFVKEHGGADVLTQPPDVGFNRLAWALHVGLGLFGAAVAGTVALRWSRHSADEPAAVAAGTETFQAQLDEELRDLD